MSETLSSQMTFNFSAQGPTFFYSSSYLFLPDILETLI